MNYPRSAQPKTWYEFCNCEYINGLTHMNQIDQVLKEEGHKSTIWSGISQKARGKNVTITLNEEFCKGCEICVEICPNKCLEMREAYPFVTDINLCSRCMLCELECPDFAIAID
jgi:2-oxoglutarate ferredoxin oxidoreductase subunit delta